MISYFYVFASDFGEINQKFEMMWVADYVLYEINTSLWICQ